MGRRAVGFLAVVVLGATSPAWPFSGCPAASKDANKCEIAIAKALGKFVAAVVKCHAKQADGAFKQKPFDDEPCESTTPGKSAKAKLDIAIGKVAAICPPAVLANAAALEDALASGATSLDQMNLVVYCDSTSGIAIDPSGDDMGWVPANKAGLKCADGVGKTIPQLWNAIVKCSTKAADTAFKGKAFDETACRTTASGKYDAAGAKLVGCPACLAAASRTGLKNALLARLDAADAALFVCASVTTTTVTTTTSTSTVVTTTTTTTSTTSTTLATSLNCPGSGTVDVVSILAPTQTTFNASAILGLQIEIGYPSGVGMPGTQFLPVNDPADPATLIALLSADFSGVGINLYDGSPTFFDADSAAPFKLKTLLSLNPTANLIFNQVVPFERARFTCTAGTPLTAAMFPCTVTSEVDILSRSIPPDQRPTCNVGFGQ